METIECPAFRRAAGNRPEQIAGTRWFCASRGNAKIPLNLLSGCSRPQPEFQKSDITDRKPPLEMTPRNP
jgi:hypothetical protein